MTRRTSSREIWLERLWTSSLVMLASLGATAWSQRHEPPPPHHREMEALLRELRSQRTEVPILRDDRLDDDGAQLTPAQPDPPPDPERILIAGVSVPFADLEPRQRQLLREIARLPELPTEVHRGVRFIRAHGRLYRDDCSNALRVPYDALGIDLFSEHAAHPDSNGVGLIREKGAETERPRVGDLVIFDNSYDRNRNGGRDDRDTHAAIVVAVEDDGTVLFYNRVRTGHRVHRMDPTRPRLVVDPSTRLRINDFLRRKRSDDPTRTAYTAGALFSRYVRVL